MAAPPNGRPSSVSPKRLATSCWQTEGFEPRLTLAFVPRPGAAAAVETARPSTLFFTTTLSLSTATGVFGPSPLHSACVGEMFPVPEGKKGLGLVSMATGRKRNNPENPISKTLEIPAPARSHPRWILQELRTPVPSLQNLSP
ncbi:uncharacterized protein LOC144233887 isoform X2 [Crocuta crocuta]